MFLNGLALRPWARCLLPWNCVAGTFLSGTAVAAVYGRMRVRYEYLTAVGTVFAVLAANQVVRLVCSPRNPRRASVAGILLVLGYCLLAVCLTGPSTSLRRSCEGIWGGWALGGGAACAVVAVVCGRFGSARATGNRA